MSPDPRRATSRPTGRKGLVLAAGIIVVLGVLLGAILAVGLNLDRAIDESNPPTLTHIYLSMAFNPYSGLDEVFPANFTIPAGADVMFTVTNYDNATNPIPDALAVVAGVRDVTGAATSGRNVTHTFTVHALGINVPIPPAQGRRPAIVTFTVHVDARGDYAWMCMAPCDPVSMVTPGFMRGTMTVA
ncbi:MAG TPA: hypothetical protein VEY12_02830 [Thermoplasmata archaeon]|nr:hypothetical protein [Thermoplasmata archaeon]